MSRLNVPRKWRPSLALLTICFCIVLVAVPIIGAVGARLTHNQFVRETETSLLAQAALVASAYAQTFQAEEPAPDWGLPLSTAQADAMATRWQPAEPRLQMRVSTIEPPRPDALPLDEPPALIYASIGPHLSEFMARAQRETLAGYRALDHEGRVIAGTGEIGLTLAHVPEVAAALRGENRSVMRFRNDEAPAHPLASLSRDTTYRIFVARPVIVGDRVVGAVYLARTPVDLVKFVHRERDALMLIGISILTAMAIAGLVFWRLIFAPITALERQSRDVAERGAAPGPIRHYGLREIANLGQSLLSMARALRRQADTVSTYTAHVTHELKSPTTSILAASELLGNEDLSPRGRKLVANIAQDGKRMEALLDRLRDLAKARAAPADETSTVAQALDRLRPQFARLEIACDGPDMEVPLGAEQLEMVLFHLAQNAAEHGATTLTLRTDPARGILDITDNGSGMSPANLDRATEPFFTTRRADGGTGMGLAIVEAILSGIDARLDLSSARSGLTARITF